jgi:hypothetical protein
MGPDEVRDPRMPLKVSNSCNILIEKLLAYNSQLAWNDIARLSPVHESKFLCNIILHESSCIHDNRKRRIRCLNGDRLRVDEYVFRRCLGITKTHRLKSKIRRTCQSKKHDRSDSLCLNPSHLFFILTDKILSTEAIDMMHRELNSVDKSKSRHWFFSKSKIEKSDMFIASNIDPRYVPADIDMDDRLRFGKVPIREVCIYDESTLPDSMECDIQPMLIDQYSVPEVMSHLSLNIPSSPIDWKIEDETCIAMVDSSRILLQAIFTESMNTMNSVYLPLPVHFDGEKMESPIKGIFNKSIISSSNNFVVESSSFVHELLNLETHVYILSDRRSTRINIRDYFFT